MNVITGTLLTAVFPAVMGKVHAHIGGANIDRLHRNLSPHKLDKFVNEYGKRFSTLEFSHVRINANMQMLAKALNENMFTHPKQVSQALEGMGYEPVMARS